LPNKVEANLNNFAITPERAYAEMGYGRVQPEEEVVRLTESLLSEMAGFSAPEYVFRLYEGRTEGEYVHLDEGASLHLGVALAILMQGAERFAVFAATAGAAFQDYQERLKKENDLLVNYVADAIGSCMAESAGDRMEKALEQETEGFRHTNRFSPGYCGWHLSEQRKLFRLLGGRPCGIEMSDVCLMKPIKSISGMIGIGRNVKEKQYGCACCELETCYKRRIKK
jgi:hypothetical protein